MIRAIIIWAIAGFVFLGCAFSDDKKDGEKEYSVSLTLKEWNEVNFVFENSSYEFKKAHPIYNKIFSQLNRQLDTLKK